MKNKVLFTVAACSAMLVPSFASAQEEVVVVEEQAVLTEVPCNTRYYVGKTDNWFLQVGAGMDAPFLEGTNSKGEHHSSLSVNYNVGFGKWFSPYMGWRLSFNGGPIHWDMDGNFNKANYVNANFDFMWDMFNSMGGVNSKRVFSIVPFVGLGGAFTWNYRPTSANILNDNGRLKKNSWTLPVSAGIQARFRLCKYVDFFAEARAAFYGDNFNNVAYGKPIDLNVTLIGGFNFNFGGREYKSYNPCDYLGYINNLNNQVNDLRGALATTAAALAAAESQLPCPDVVETTVIAEEEVAPLMATVRFSINSARISSTEMVNVYNTAEWMKANPDQNVAIVGYADRDTGTADYNMGLSQRRAQAVYDALTNTYGINPDRLSINAQGSSVQPYDVNNWNRIVIFNSAK